MIDRHSVRIQDQIMNNEKQYARIRNNLGIFVSSPFIVRFLTPRSTSDIRM